MQELFHEFRFFFNYNEKKKKERIEPESFSLNSRLLAVDQILKFIHGYI